MNLKEIVRKAKDFSRPYRVTKGKKFRLDNHEPGDIGELKSKDKARAKEALGEGICALAEMQERLFAQNKWAVLLIFQAMDAAGKDGVIKHVMSGVNPQGCEVISFKVPSAEELDHDFLWRCHRWIPQRGRIGIFNRSYYEETLIVRVHRELLDLQQLPAELVSDRIWKDRFEDIRHFERYLTRNGVVIRKFFLNVSRREQRQRFLDRLSDPAKHWKFSMQDLKERKFWPGYMKAYEDMIQETATEEAPWYIVPADNKWFARVVVAAAIVDTLASLKVEYPQVTKAQRQELEEARTALLRKKS